MTDRAVSWWVLVLAALAIAAVAAFGAVAAGCYAHNGPTPPTCAQDPTQEWCAPPAFARAPDGGRD